MSNLLYELRNSGIHNNGLFAARDIRKGEYIIEYVGEKITKAESERRALEWDKHARTRGHGLVYIFELNKRYDIDGNVDDNPAKFINHSCEPNCEAINTRGRIWIVATRDIPQGEELGYDYGYDLEHFLDHHCLCGKNACVGYIVRADLRKRVKQLLKGKHPAHMEK